MAPKNPKFKRILAWIGIILLVSMYLVTLVLALSGSEHALKFVIASVGMTIVVPVLIYAMQMAYQIVSAGKNDGSEGPKTEAENEAEAETETEVEEEAETETEA